MAGLAVLVGLTIWGAAGGHPERLALDLVVGLLGVAAVPLMNRRPVLGAVLVNLLVVLSPAATPPATYGTLVVAQRRRFPVAAGVAGLGIAAHAVLGLLRPAGGLSYAWWLSLVAIAYGALVGWGQLAQARWALIASLRQRAQRAEADQAARLAEARGQERSRIAREMHDVLAHRLSLVATYAGALEYRPDAPPEQLARAAGVVRTGVAQALAELREVIGVLREDTDASSRPQPVWADLARLVDEARAAGQPVDVEDGVTGSPPDGLARTAYRVVQEGLTNARRHAPGATVTIVLGGQTGDGLSLALANPLTTSGHADDPGLGLTGLAERVALAGGRITAGSRDGAFRLRVWLPWPP
jgi:signal transduction histidine kinase